MIPYTHAKMRRFLLQALAISVVTLVIQLPGLESIEVIRSFVFGFCIATLLWGVT
jgi:hypothetical protein